MDTVVTIAFVLFIVFIIRGYHQSKLEQREKDEKKDNQ